MYWFLTAIYCLTQSYLFTAQTWITPFVAADNHRREKVHSRPRPQNFTDSVIHKISGETVIICKVFSVMKVSQWNEFPGWIRVIQSLIAYRKCCKAFIVDFHYIQNLFAVIWGRGHRGEESRSLQTQLLVKRRPGSSTSVTKGEVLAPLPELIYTDVKLTRV